MILISSSQNPVFKEVRSLKNRKDREEKGLFCIEGLRSVDEALKEKADIAGILVSEEFAANQGHSGVLGRMEALDVKMHRVTDKLFREISDTETPQGILAVMKMKTASMSELTDTGGLYLILDSIRDPGNMGTIIRTADAAGFSGVILSKGCVDPYNPKVLRSTMGSIFHIPLFKAGDLPEAIRLIRSKGIKVYASHLDSAVSIFDTGMTSGTAVIIGSEADGVSGEAAALADALVRIPMPGRAESLNASVAAGIIMFEAVRQRQ